MAIKSPTENPLGSYLKARRAKLAPPALNLPSMRRRTPGLRREEVAQRAHVSVTWYTWLEQGRGGAPSADVLDRLARALELGETEREHLYLLAQSRLPEVAHAEPPTSVSPQTQRLLDTLEINPALVKDAAWNILAWNEAAAAVLIDYALLPSSERNVLRLVFCHPRIGSQMPDWERTARFLVANFRTELARSGMFPEAKALIESLQAANPEFAKMWEQQDVCKHGEGTKRVQPADGDPITFEYSSFAVDGQPGLSMVIYTPATPMDVERVRTSISSRRALGGHDLSACRQ